MSTLPPYLTIEKVIGETPLEALERLRRERGISSHVPMAYAGRLDPMAHGKLLILIGDECKVQEAYHTLDKEYVFEVLLGVHSDTADILGLVQADDRTPESLDVRKVAQSLIGPITLPYPHFSSKTVGGKPLHVWTLEGRLNEIAIPTKTSVIHTLTHTRSRTLTAPELHSEVLTKINSLKTVTDPRKALGEDFRRDKVRSAWERVIQEQKERIYTLHTFTCIASSGTYMRSLAELIGEEFGTQALAMDIKRTTIGRYKKISFLPGFWIKTF